MGVATGRAEACYGQTFFVDSWVAVCRHFYCETSGAVSGGVGRRLSFKVALSRKLGWRSRFRGGSRLVGYSWPYV